jgi:hypothetical protein
MTTNTLMIGNPQRPQPAQKPRERLDSFTQMPTSLITLPPEFVAALRKVAPKVRSRKLAYVLVMAVVATVGVASGLRIWARPDVAPLVLSPASPLPTAGTPPSTAVMVPNALRSDDATKDKAGGSPAAAPTTISVDDLPRAGSPKAPKNRQVQKPLTAR